MCIKGEPLFELYSQDLQVAEAGTHLGRQISESLGRKRQSGDPTGSAEPDRFRQMKLRLWDVAEQDIEAIAQADQPPKDVPFRSPATGHIEDKMIVQGSAVQMGMKLMRVADHTKMWLDAEVYEEQLPVVEDGSST